jgi:Putative Ig domain
MSLQWITPAGFLFTATAAISTSVSVVATGSNVSYRLLSGSLPAGLSFNTSTGIISGTAINVLRNTSTNVCIRISDDTNVKKDRTFSIDVGGNTSPVWDTDEGFLPVGDSGKKYALNNQWVNYQLDTHDLSSSTITYSLVDGVLPPGLILSESGVISGFIKDKLTFDSLGISPQSYDTGKFDAFGYDPVLAFSGNQVIVQLVSQPKNYQFSVAVDDGDLSATRVFNIMVVNEDMFRADSVYLNYDDSIISTNKISANSSYLQVPKFLNGSDLGTVRADNNIDLDVSAYNIDFAVSTMTYSIITGTDVSSNLPTGLTLDTAQGHIYGYLPYQPAYTRTYNFTVSATKSNFQTDSIISAVNTFTLRVEGNVFSSIEWLTDSDLGNIDANIVSELYIKAHEISADYNIKYQIIDGQLPNGLTLAQDGTIIGRADFNPGNFSFTVLASDIYGLTAISRTFTLAVSIENNFATTQIYIKPFLKNPDRDLYQNFINDRYIFDPTMIYRYFDPNFGVQKDTKMFLEYGIQLVDLSFYASALDSNFYRKNLYFGDLQIAEAKNDAGEVVYEVVYLDIVDPISNSTSGVTAEFFNDAHGRQHNPASIPNMRNRLETIQLPAGDGFVSIKINEKSLPLFMRTPQGSRYSPANYIPVSVICYAKPGQGMRIVNRIRRSGFDFKNFNFDIDRIVVENNSTVELPNTLGPNIIPAAASGNTAKYLLIERQNIADVIPSDSILKGVDGFTI